MQNILQRHWCTTVRRETPDSSLDAKTVYCGTDGEMCARLVVDPVSLKIISAVLEQYAHQVKITEINALTGEEAYFNSGPVLKRELADFGEFPRLLFAETVRGVIQAETFIWDVRGYASAADYSSYWDKFYAGSCHYYSNLDKVTQQWYQYVPDHRAPNLFNRFKQQTVNKHMESGYQVKAQLSDSFHEMDIELDLDDDFTVRRARGGILRAPDNVCREAAKYVHNINGLRLNQLQKKEIASLMGLGNGCVHLIDLVFDAAETIKIIINTL